MDNKMKFMSAVEIRAEIDNLLDVVQNKDETFLKVVHAMLGTYVQEKEEAVVGYKIDGTPIGSEEAIT
ncbi:MAG: hypothetical protein AAGJ82_15900, partial [Bacteroidota bacterium]